VENGQHGDPETAWGEPPDDGSGVGPAGGPDADAARRSFWGADCVLPGGLLDRAYARLAIPRRAWPGLKRLPEVGGLARSERGALLETVAAHLAPLGGQMPTVRSTTSVVASAAAAAAAAEAEAAAAAAAAAAEAEAAAAAAAEAAAAPSTPCTPGPAGGDDTDSDLEDDMRTLKALAEATGSPRSAVAAAAAAPLSAGWGAGLVLAPPRPPPRVDSVGDLLSGDLLACDFGAPPPAPPPPPTAPPPSRRRPPPTAKAVAAIMELLEGCVDVEAAGAGRDGGHVPAAATPPPLPPPASRWYDARSRTALRRVAHWLHVPWSKAAAFERLLATTLAPPPPPPPAAAAAPAASAWDRSVKAAAVAGTTLGVGALFAVTGGLAAPVVAAGVASAIAAVGGAGAAASAAAASAFLTTSAGTALVAGGVGAGGGAFAGHRMARRVGDVKEFGFVRLQEEEEVKVVARARVEADAPPAPPPPPPPPHLPVPADDDHPLAATFRPPSPPRMDRGGDRSRSPSPRRDRGPPPPPPLLPAPATPDGGADEARLAATICVAGWARERRDLWAVWARARLPADGEPFALVWESAALLALDRAIGTWMRNQAAQEAVKLALQHWLYTGRGGRGERRRARGRGAAPTPAKPLLPPLQASPPPPPAPWPSSPSPRSSTPRGPWPSTARSRPAASSRTSSSPGRPPPRPPAPSPWSGTAWGRGWCSTACWSWSAPARRRASSSTPSSSAPRSPCAPSGGPWPAPRSPAGLSTGTRAPTGCSPSCFARRPASSAPRAACAPCPWRAWRTSIWGRSSKGIWIMATRCPRLWS